MRAFGTDVWENLFYLYLAVALVIGALIIAWLCTSLVKYRARAGDPRPPDAPRPGVIPAERGHVIWVWVMAATIAIILAALAFQSIRAIAVVEDPPMDASNIYHNVTGFQFGWKVNYTGENGIPFQLIGDYYIPVDTNIVMNVTSQDVWHNFAVPDFRIRVDAIPGTVNHMWFKATEVGDTRMQCVMLCGSGHALMLGTIHAVSQTDYQAWLHQSSMSEYQKIVKKPGKATSVVNATFDGVTLNANGTAKANQPLVVAVNNTGTQTATFRLHDNESSRQFDVPAGQVGYAYFETHADTVLFDGPNTASNIQVVS
jgi:cytochrome c oxidase subunit 2